MLVPPSLSLPPLSFTDKLQPFWCYNISVYPIWQDQVGKPYSIQAYVKEGSMYGQGPVAGRKH